MQSEARPLRPAPDLPVESEWAGEVASVESEPAAGLLVFDQVAAAVMYQAGSEFEWGLAGLAFAVLPGLQV